MMKFFLVVLVLLVAMAQEVDTMVYGKPLGRDTGEEDFVNTLKDLVSALKEYPAKDNKPKHKFHLSDLFSELDSFDYEK